MNFIFVKIIQLLLVFLLSNFSASADFSEWIDDFKSQASEHGISKIVLDKAFINIKKPNLKILKLYNNQPEFKITFSKYYARNINKKRIESGKKLLKKHETLLNRVFKQYNIPPEIIVAIWGIETSYGKYIGNFNIIDALSTLAYQSKRKKFFKKELLSSLLILEKGYFDKNKILIGSWAGAMGQSQFMPSSYLNYAIDYNDDKKIDIWNNYHDIFASIANYLKLHGWKENEGWSNEILIKKEFQNQIKNNTVYKINELEKLVVDKESFKKLNLTNEILLKVINKEEPKRYFLKFHNFKIIKKYNNSDFYALVIGNLANKIKDEY